MPGPEPDPPGRGWYDGSFGRSSDRRLRRFILVVRMPPRWQPAPGSGGCPRPRSMGPRTGATVAAGLLGLALVALAAIQVARSLLSSGVEVPGPAPRPAAGTFDSPSSGLPVSPDPGHAGASIRTYRGAEDDLRRTALRGTGPEAHAARGLFALKQGHPDQAVRDLERAVAEAPADVTYRNDLAAAYLALGDAGRPVAYLMALGVLERALDLAPDDPVLLFNRAAALEKSHLIRLAISAWSRVEDEETDPEWVAAAREHLGRIEEPNRTESWEALLPALDEALAWGDRAWVREIVGRFPHRSERHAEALLDRWAAATPSGSPPVAGLDQVRILAEVLAHDHGLLEAADTVSAFNRLVDAPSRAAWVLAYRQYAQGRDLCDRDRGAEGAALLDQAAGSGAPLGEPLRSWVSYYQARSAYTGTDYQAVISTLSHLLETPGIERYPRLAAQAWWLLGLARFAVLQPSESLAAYRQAAALLEDAGSEETAALGSLLAELYSALGRQGDAWFELDRALAWAVLDGSPRGLYRALNELADTAARSGELEAALLVREEVLSLALEDPEDAPGITHAYLRRAEASLALGDLDGAREDLRQAWSWCAQIQDEGERRRREADLLMVQGRASAQEDPLGALAALSRAVELYGSTGTRFFVAEALLERAGVYRTLGDPEAEGSDLRDALADFERQRADLLDPALRLSYFARAGDLFDALIGLEASKPRGKERAFDYAERSRARVLGDLVAARGGGLTGSEGAGLEPLPVEEILWRFPEDVAVVEYAVLPDRTLAWVLSSQDGLTMVELPVGGEDLDRRVRVFLRALRSSRFDDESYQAPARELYALVVAPLAPYLDPGDALVLIPDKALQSLPFSALIDPDSGEPLLRERLLATAPSATLYAADLERGSLQPAPGRLASLVLAYGEERRDLGLDELKQAEREAEAVAIRYGGRATLLAGPEATPEAFMDLAPAYDVVHLTLHAKVNRDYPHLSRVFLAPGESRADGAVYAFEIQGMDLSGTYLAVLAGCETGAGPAVSTEGVMSLARGFLAAGVHRVLASLWLVDDDLAPAFSDTFHKNLLAGQTPAEALRSTQLEMLASPDDDLRAPGFWAGFQVVGGF